MCAIMKMASAVRTPPRGSRGNTLLWIFWTVIWVSCGLLHVVTGDCLYKGHSYNDHSVWQPDPCSVCTCRDPVPVCESIVCTPPICNYTHGEKLELRNDQCCPVCVNEKKPCDFRDRKVQHGREWKASSCQTCQCLDGHVVCGDTQCPSMPCKPGETSQTLRGQCCPICLPAGRVCIQEDGTRKPDGSEWSPLTCVKCVCRDGYTRCMSQDCPPVQCPGNTKPSFRSGQCCPVCEENVCQRGEEAFKAGDAWNKDDCTTCTCRQGNITCHSLECEDTLDCPSGQVSQTLNGQCCRQCVRKRGQCQTNRHGNRYHGEMWRVEPCEFCTCQRGVVSCQRAQCPPILCKQGKAKKTVPGECCPRCVAQKKCTFKDISYVSRQSWDPDSCSSCECQDGAVTCYSKECPAACDNRQVANISTSTGPCCQECQMAADGESVRCNEKCLACNSNKPDVCISCKDKDKLIQNGRCVDTCESRFYPDTDNVCKGCHETCDTCYGGSQFHCLSCRQDKLMKNGQCVSHCGVKHFVRERQCFACHPSCLSCRGRRANQCLECSLSGQVVLHGTCVDSCKDGYFLQGQHCAKCRSSCQTCLPDGTTCASCPRGRYLINGRCRGECPGSHYIDDRDTCQVCHPSCRDCRGPSNTDCVECVHGRPLEGGECSDDGGCSDGQYFSVGRRCLDCFPGCKQCHPDVIGEGTTCSLCLNPSQVPFGSRCYLQCPLGSVLRSGVCVSCEPKCRRCDSSGQCLQCFNPFLVTKGGHCVMDCGNGRYKDNGRCVDCAKGCLQCVNKETCHSCATPRLLKKGRCVTTCGQRYIERLDRGICEENVFPPEIKVVGPITIINGYSADVTESFITLTDADTSIHYLSVAMETPPRYGHFVKVGARGNHRLSQGDYFMLDDLRQRKIQFIKDKQPYALSDSVRLKSFDGQLYSSVVEVPIRLGSRDGLSLVSHKRLVVERGSDVVINEGAIAVKVSEDSSEEKLVFNIVNGPNYGSWMNTAQNKAVKLFTVDDLRAGIIIYDHHGNRSHAMDMIRLFVDDGVSQMYLLMEIKVIDKKSLLPVVITNTGGQVHVGGMVRITKTMLETEPRGKKRVASHGAVYILIPSKGNPRNGQVLMVVPTPTPGPSEGWEEVGGGKMAAMMRRFTQRDIDDGYIYYKHTGTDGNMEDEILFEVSDTSRPPNTLKDQTFQIHVLSSDTSPLSTPTLAPGVSLGMTVFENQIVPITSSHMTFHDDDTPSTDLLYKITSLLAPREGSVEHIDQPFRRALQFSQNDINNNRIIYRPPVDEVGDNPIDVSFSFIVTDGKPAQDMQEHQFTIHVVPVNNIPPQFTHPLVNVSLLERGHVQISSAMLEVVDADTAQEQLRLELTVAPAVGVLERRVNGAKAVLRKDDQFSINDIHNSEITYKHTGGIHPPHDVIVFSVTDGEHTANATISIFVVKMDSAPPQMEPTASCQLNVSEGASVAISRNEIVFSDDSDDRDEDITIVLSKGTTHGYFIKDGTRVHQGEGFTQQDINMGLVIFQVEQEIGPKPITELVYINVTDSSGNTLPNQILSVAMQPIDNRPPVVTFGPTPVVEEGGQIVLNPDSLKVMDMDSHLTSLRLVIRRPPTFGVIRTRRPDRGSERGITSTVRSFAVTDLIDGNIVYANTDHQGKEPIADAFLFYVTDGKNDSPVHRLNVTIHLKNDEKPSIVTEQLFVEEGQTVTLTNASMFVVDLDSLPEELVFTLESVPTNGVLLKKGLPMYTLDKSVVLKDKTTFTYEDILKGLIVYQHDDGETSQDSIRLELTDGDFSDSKTVNIVVGVVNDETPRVTVNKGLRVKAGSKTPITSRDLKATDLDSEDSEIKYTIVHDPRAGRLQFDNQRVQYIMTSTTGAASFQQRDIDKGHILYSHSVGEMAGNILFKFKLTDPEGNELIDQDFFITVLEDRLLPLEVTNTEFVVTEGQEVKLTTDFLSYTDHDSETGSLAYTLLDGPHMGHLELTGQQGVPIVTFTQADLAASAVLYVHTSTDEDPLDKFIFSVTDGKNEVMSSLYIRIDPIDDALPSLVNKGLRVQEGVRKLITEFNLKAVDKDTTEQLIMFTIVNPPIHGSLDLMTQDGHHNTVTSFTMADVYENRVSYQHDGSETVSDAFSFLVDDGTNKAFTMQQDQPYPGSPISTPQDFEITVLPMDDGMPVLEVNLGLQYLEPMNGGQVGSVISSRELMTLDEDTTPDEIVYTVTQPPTWGILESSVRPGQILTSFTQDEVDKGLVSYKLTNSTQDEFQDMFVFDVGDSRPNTVPGNEFHIVWSVISMASTTFNVSEMDGALQVPIIRKGNLKQYSIVKCVTSLGTAGSRQRRGQATLHDFVPVEGQVQFDEWQDKKTCNILIKDDAVLEGDETFYVHLQSPSYAVLGDTVQASVIIQDQEDAPTFQFSKEVIQVNETDGLVKGAIIRSGDLSRSMSVVCSTKSMTATGSSLQRLESGSDFVSRGTTNEYRIVFPAEVAEASCDVKLVDDSEFETMEQFEMRLSRPSFPATLGDVDALIVVIEGPNDESFIYLSEEEYAFPENSGKIELAVTREGSDLSHTSSVWCATRLSSTPSARPGQDYIPSSTQITFGPGQFMQYCPLTLLDDEFQPRLEGNETFHVFLSSAMGSNLKQPIQATVVVYDDVLDLPRINFAQERYMIDEHNKIVNVSVVRQGDINLASSVICYTRQGTAEVGVDFVERPYTNESRVYFKPGEKVKSCLVNILDDASYEPEETFLLKLGLAQGSNNTLIGDLGMAVITIADQEDEPRILFDKSSYSIREPSVKNQVGVVTLTVRRLGAVNGTAWVRCSTRDGSAVSGVDYNAKSVVLRFQPGEQKLEFSVDVLYNSDLEWHESFSVQLGPEVSMGTQIGRPKVAMVTILDNEVSGSLVLPAPPLVVSLLHFDAAETGMKIQPSPGYPLVCISPCDPQHPTYSDTYNLCQDANINHSDILYSWEVAMPPLEDDNNEGDDGDNIISSPFVAITDQTLFTFTDRKVLDSVYFRSYFRVRCVAQPLHENGNPGVPITSLPVTIGHSNPICKAPSLSTANLYTHNAFQAQSFLARLEYVEPGDDTAHPNTLHISIEIPHQDGMLPLVSTRPLHNLKLLLSTPLYRQQHICSNIVFTDELLPMLGRAFLEENEEEEYRVIHLRGPGKDFPYQFDEELRSKETLRLYRHLNLKSCKWQFDAWYHMTELVDLCGGHVLSDFQVKDKSLTHLTVRVPLYVSYVFVTAPRGWSSMEHHSDMEFSFYYSTVLWSSGMETEERQEGRLQVVRILIGDDGKLVVEFRTQAKYRGLFVMGHHSLPDVQSVVTAPKSLIISLDLDLVWSQATFDGPLQMWRAKSRYNLKDYTGVYRVDLVPCLVSPTQGFVDVDPIPCTARQPERFEIPISFQQTNRPVPVLYSLGTEFQLGNSLEMFVSDPGTQHGGEDWDFNGAFSKGERLYGRVLWHRDQDLKDGYRLALDQVFLCTGRDGFVPSFDPTGEMYGQGSHYGCLQPSKELLYRFLILDAQSPEDQDSQFHQVPFNAVLAGQDSRYRAMVDMPGVDGFAMDIDPLYKVNSGHQWYLQVVYTISVAGTSTYRQRRSILSSSSSSSFSSSSYRNLIYGYRKQQKQKPIQRQNPYSEVRYSQNMTHKLQRWKRSEQGIPIDLQDSKYSINSNANKRSEINKTNGNDNDAIISKRNYNRDTEHTNSSPLSYSSSSSGTRNGTTMQLVHLVFHTDTYPSTSPSTIATSPSFYLPVIIVGVLLICVVFVCIRKRAKRKQESQHEYPSSFITNFVTAKSNPHGVARVKLHNVNKQSKKNLDAGDDGEEKNSIISPMRKSNLCKVKDVNINDKNIRIDCGGTEV